MGTVRVGEEHARVLLSMRGWILSDWGSTILKVLSHVDNLALLLTHSDPFTHPSLVVGLQRHMFDASFRSGR